jgi:hypothetical protein
MGLEDGVAMTALVIAKFAEKGKLEWTTKFF